MAKYIGPVCKLCRREGYKMFLKGERCFTAKCAFEKRPFAPGEHGRVNAGRGGADRKSVLFITHDLEEAIALSDRVVVLAAGPATHPLGEFTINLARPRDVAEIRMQPDFVALHEAIWQVLKSEVLKGYAQSKR